jgi:hypothetical protein
MCLIPFLFLLQSNIDLGAPAEVPDEGSNNRPNVGHFQDDMGPESFVHIIFEHTLGMLPIPSKSVEYFGSISGKITVLVNTGWSRRMTTKFDGNGAIIDQGLAAIRCFPSTEG